ncbi:hypothetical protein ACFPC0_24855 [Streptomyces andamanensis]|uniref:Uncharacterized protein n=1 Tax=Streptomyces andamanensis TaxID=1565035 RepID=A0ABV8TKP5_9ACTN
MSGDGEVAAGAKPSDEGTTRAKRGRPRKRLDRAGLDPKLRAFAAELRLLVGERSYGEVANEIFQSRETVASACRGESLKSRAVVTAIVKCCGGDVEEWDFKWGAVALHLADAGLHRLLPRDDLLDLAALREALKEKEVLLRALERTELEHLRDAAAKVEPLLDKLDEDLPTTTEKNGRDAAECWGDLTDYLRRLVLIFDPAPIPTNSRGHADLTVVLDRLAGLGRLNGVKENEWEALATQIRSSYELANHSKWWVVNSDGMGGVYGDEFARYRAQAGRAASDLARVSSYPDLDAAVIPAAVMSPLYDPPRRTYIDSAIAFVVLGVLVTLVLACVGVSAHAWKVWGLLALAVVVVPVVGFLACVPHARRD